MAVPLEFIIIFFGILGIMIGIIIPKFNFLKNLSSILFIVLSVVIFSDGITGLNNLTTEVIASVLFGIGIISLITDNFSEGEQDEYFSQDEREVFEDV